MSDVKIFTDMIEEAALQQVQHIAELDAFKDAKIRIMPDVHAGKGCVCGFTADLGEKVVPSLIGVDIGCGMLTIKLGCVDIDFEQLDRVIREVVPAGQNVHDEPVAGYDEVDGDADPRGCIAQTVKQRLDYFDRSVGTLGGGNHFIEVDVDQNGCKYLIIHTGSRNFGKVVCDYWQDVAVTKSKDVELTDDELDSIINDL